MSRATFTLRVRAEDGIDEIRALRAWLKRGLRDFGLVCVEAFQQRGANDMINYADADDTRRPAPIPEGPYQLKASVILGGYGEDGTLTLAKNGHSMHLSLVCTAVIDAGEFQGRKIFERFTVAVSETAKELLEANKFEKLQTAVRIGRAKIKALINSARGLDPDDKSEATEAKRVIESHDDLSGMTFYAEVHIDDTDRHYGAKNYIYRFIQPGDDDYPTPVPVQEMPPPKTPRNGGGPVRREDLDDEIPF